MYFVAELKGSNGNVIKDILRQNLGFNIHEQSRLFEEILDSYNVCSQQKSFRATSMFLKIANEILQSYSNAYGDFYFDNHIMWSDPKTIDIMRLFFGSEIKILLIVRSTQNCMASLIEEHQCKFNSPKFYELSNQLKQSYVVSCAGYTQHKNMFCVVDYDEFVLNPAKELCRIEDFFGIQSIKYDLSKVNFVQHIESKQVLGSHYNSFAQPEFWLETPKTIVEPNDLDRQLQYSLAGDFEKGWELCKKIEKEDPDNHRAAFNRGWYVLRNGNLLKGHQLLARGRIEEVFGNPVPITPAPLWDGKAKGTVMLVLEGGLGDQIHGAGMVKYITAKGCDVIVACDDQLMSVLNHVKGVKSVVSLSGLQYVFHDFWVPGMSAVLPLGLEYNMVDGRPYIPAPTVIKGPRFRIGLRWQGNPKFEHQQHRLFPSNLLFDAVQDFEGVEFISLQRDEGAEHTPSWVKQVPLNNWVETQHAIASCNLIISSCTSVAHMSAAMGVETWIVVPILPYYLWAKPGSKTEWYDSVTLFRQEKYGTWVDPFNKINQQLKFKLGEKNAYQNRLLDSSGKRNGSASLGLQAAAGKN